MIDIATEYLEKDRYQNIGMLEAIKRNSAEIISVTDGGVLLKESTSWVHQISADDLETAISLSTDFSSDFIVINQMFMRDYFMKRFGYKHSNECVQAVYTESTPIKYESDLTVRTLTLEHFDYVCKHYHMNSPRHIAEEIKSKSVFGGFNSRGTLVGFIGLHTDGSMGMLFIHPRYRNKGYARALEVFLINYLVEMGRVPYSHILLKNEKSLNLQQSLGMYCCDEHISWLF